MLDMIKNLASFKSELSALERQLAAPNIFSDASYPKLARRYKQLKDVVGLIERHTKLSQQHKQASVLAERDGELAQLAQSELGQLSKDLAQIEADLEDMLLIRDPNDSKSALVEIRAGAGGDEAGLFVGDIYRMYKRFGEKQNWQIELIQQNISEVGGFKEIIFLVKGKNAYRSMKFESGVHRVQRIPSTESQGRIHTSTITVAVMPEAEEEDIKISPGDIKVDTYRSSGNGGQSVNTTDSAVRITHLESGIVVTCQDEKSQLKNRQKAMNVLRSRLLQQQINQEHTKISDMRRKLIGSGERSEKIRTYNFPQDRITDHRVNYTRKDLTGALNGEIEDIHDQLAQAETKLIRAESQ